MRKKSLLKSVLLIAIMYIPSTFNLFTGNNLFAQKDNGKVNNTKEPDNSSSAINAKNNPKIKLTVDKVVNYLIKNNTDVKKLLLEYKKTSSELMNFNSKYDHYLYANGNYSYSENPNESSAVFQGTSTTRRVLGFGVQKNYNTGTSIRAGINSIYSNIEGAGLPGIPMGGEGYETGISVEIKQELLKNFLGYSERLTGKKLINAEKINKQIVQLKLAGLLVDALTGYWNVAIAEENVETSRINFDSTNDIRNLIIKKSRLGLSENEDITDWNGKVLQTKNNYDKAKKFLFDAKLSIIRTLDLDSGIDIEIGKTFVTTPPVISHEQALKDAFSKRIDWNNQQALIRNAELEYKIAYSEQLPSLTVNLSAGNRDYDPNYDKSFDEVNKEYSVGFEITYPLENRSAGTRMRNAEIELQTMHVDRRALEKTIRDEIASMVKECELNYKVYEQTKKSSVFAKDYYAQVYKKFKRARYSALQLKSALDGFIFARQEELKSLIDYNIALLKLDFARNIIFENLDIDIEKILESL